jgi:hypothetical protein
MPKFLGLMHADASSESEAPPDAELVTKMGVLVEQAVNAGVLLSTDGLKASKYGKRVVAENGVSRVIDGPFTESKELIASYALMQCADMEEAIVWTKKFLEVIGTGTVEIRPIFELEEFAEFMSPEDIARENAWRDQMARNAEQAN